MMYPNEKLIYDFLVFNEFVVCRSMKTAALKQGPMLLYNGERIFQPNMLIFKNKKMFWGDVLNIDSFYYKKNTKDIMLTLEREQLNHYKKIKGLTNINIIIFLFVAGKSELEETQIEGKYYIFLDALMKSFEYSQYTTDYFNINLLVPYENLPLCEVWKTNK